MNVGNFLIGYVRTYVPIAIGAGLAWLAQRFDFIISPEAYDQAGELVTVLVIGIYYGGVRLLEQRWGWIGWFLGAAKQPVYVPPETESVTAHAPPPAPDEVIELSTPAPEI